jgi:sugar lactone lactonase YvrE
MKHLFFLLIVSLTSYAQDRVLKLEPRHLATRVYAPEGLAITPNGSVIIGSNTEGRVFQYQQGEKRFVGYRELYDYSKYKGWDPEVSMVMGLAAEHDDFIWVALPGLHGGCIAGLIPSTRRSGLVKCGLGDVNGLAISKKNGMLYVSSKDTGLTKKSGKIFAFSLKNLHATRRSKIGIFKSHRENVFLELDMPNGLAMSPDEQLLFVSQTLEGKILSIGLKTKRVRTLKEFNGSGWLDGLTYVPTHQLYIALDNKNARIHLFKLSGETTSIELVGIHSERIGLASVSVWQDNVFITDLWEPSDLGVLLGATILSKKSAIMYNNSVYKIQLSELIELSAHDEE